MATVVSANDDSVTLELSPGRHCPLRRQGDRSDRHPHGVRGRPLPRIPSPKPPPTTRSSRSGTDRRRLAAIDPPDDDSTYSERRIHRGRTLRTAEGRQILCRPGRHHRCALHARLLDGRPQAQAQAGPRPAGRVEHDDVGADRRRQGARQGQAQRGARHHRPACRLDRRQRGRGPGSGQPEHRGQRGRSHHHAGQAEGARSLRRSWTSARCSSSDPGPAGHAGREPVGQPGATPSSHAVGQPVVSTSSTSTSASASSKPSSAPSSSPSDVAVGRAVSERERLGSADHAVRRRHRQAR